MTSRDWDQHYEDGFLPWDTDEPDPNLVAAVERFGIVPGRALDIGCGTGVHAMWLASRGFDVLGIDVAPRAVERAEARAAAVTAVAEGFGHRLCAIRINGIESSEHAADLGNFFTNDPKGQKLPAFIGSLAQSAA